MTARPVLFLACALYLTVSSFAAQAAPVKPRLDTPSGYPVPRFVSLKGERTNCRTGPSFSHPVRFVFQRAGAPVLVIAESVDNWRKIRDPAGDECWAHRTTLKAQTRVLTLHRTMLRTKPAPNAPSAAEIGSGVLMKLEKKRSDWLEVSVDGRRGWTRASEVWGGDALDAPAGRN